MPSGIDPPRQAGGLDARTASRRPLWIALAGALLPLLAFRTLLDPRKVLAAGDMAFFHLPLRTLLGRALAEGVPWWNGAIHGGQPILSNPNYAAFYPPTWLALALPPAIGIHLLLLGHAAWAYIGAWRLARHLGCRPLTALFAAVGLTVGGAFVSSASLLTLFCGLAWSPWILLWGCRAIDEPSRRGRRAGLWLALGLAAQFLAGEPVNCILSGLGLAGLVIDAVIERRAGVGGPGRLGRLPAAIALALALAGVQLLPTIARLSDSGRAGGLEPAVVTHRSMPPARLLELAVPHPFGDPMRIDDELFFGQGVFDEGAPYLVSIYPGLLVFVLAVGGLTLPGVPRRWTWITMLAAGTYLALGRFNPLYEAVVPYLPIFDRTRYPEKMFLVASVALPFLAALALEARLSSGPQAGGRQAGGRRLDVASFLCALTAALVAALLGLYLVEPEAVVWLANSLRPIAVPPAYVDDLGRWARLDLALTLLVTSAAWWLLRMGSGGAPSRPYLALAFVALLGFDLARTGWALLPVVPRSAVDRPPETLAAPSPAAGRLFTDFALSDDARVPLRHPGPGPDQFWHGREVLEPYIATLWGYDYAMHHDYDLMLTRPARRALEALEAEWGTPQRAQRLLGSWGVGLVALQRPLADVLRERYTDRPAPRLRFEANPHRLPEVRWVGRIVLHDDATEALAAVRDAGYDSDTGHWIATAGSGARPAASTPPAATEDSRPGPTPADDASSTERSPPVTARTSWSRIEIDTAAHHPRYLQAARTWDVGWRAEADGLPLAVHETATGQIGLVVPAEARRVVLRYFDPRVLWGAALSLSGLVVGFVVWRSRTPAPRAPAPRTPEPGSRELRSRRSGSGAERAR